jgi:hypothetical protein
LSARFLFADEHVTRNGAIAIVLPQASFLIRTTTDRCRIRDPKTEHGRAHRIPGVLEALMQSKFHIGQLVRITRPSSGYADHRTYCIVCLVPQANGFPVYRVKNTVGAERLVRADEIEPAALTAVP